MPAALLAGCHTASAKRMCGAHRTFTNPGSALRCTLSHRSQPSPSSKELTLEGSREGTSSLQGPAVGQELHTCCLCDFSQNQFCLIMSNK